MYMKTWERDRVNHFDKYDQRLRVYNAVSYNGLFPVDPDDPVKMELQCIKNYLFHLIP